MDPPKTINILVLHSRFYFSFVFLVMRLPSHLFLSWSEPECAQCQPPCQTLSARERITPETVQDLKFYIPSPWHSPFLFNRCSLFLVIFYPSICIFIVSLLISLCLAFSLHCNVFLHLFFHFSSYLCHYCWFPPIFCIRPLSPVTIWFRNKYSSRILQDYALVSSFFFVPSSLLLFFLSWLIIFHFSHCFV